jgi:hypothetical protein
MVSVSYLLLEKGKAIPVTGHGGPQDCERSRLPHFVDSSQMAVRLARVDFDSALSCSDFWLHECAYCRQ